MTRLLTQYGQVTYMRLLSEMNNGGQPVLALRPERPLARPRLQLERFKQAWRRAAIILRGGSVASMNRRLKRLHLPKVKTGAEHAAEAEGVALLGAALVRQPGDRSDNHPKHFWPGAGYVDWVGTTWYSPHPNSGAMSSFYNYPKWRSKPFAFAEWGVWGAESPGFVGKFFGFLKSHPRVRMADLLPVGQPQARVPAVHAPAVAGGAAQGDQLVAPAGLAPEFGLVASRSRGRSAWTSDPGVCGRGGP